jgi:uncharacterized membrane protein required for colicin V production
MMHWFDISASLLLLLGCLWSCWRGFTREVIALLGLIAVILLSAQAYPHVIRLLEPLTARTWLRQTIGSSAIVLAAWFAYILVGRLVRGLVKAARPSIRQRLLGGLVGVAKMTIGVAALLILWTHLNPQAAAQLTATSKMAPPLLQVAHLMAPFLPADLQTAFEQFYRRNRAQIDTDIPLLSGRSNAAPSTSGVPPKTRPPSQPNPPGISPNDDQALRRLIHQRLRDP